MVSGNLKVSTVGTVLLKMLSGGGVWGLFHYHLHSFELLHLQLVIITTVDQRYADLSLSWIRLMAVLSSAYFRRFSLTCCLQSVRKLVIHAEEVVDITAV